MCSYDLVSKQSSRQSALQLDFPRMSMPPAASRLLFWRKSMHNAMFILGTKILCMTFLRLVDVLSCKLREAFKSSRFTLRGNINILGSYTKITPTRSACYNWNTGMIFSSLALTVFIALKIRSSYAASFPGAMPTVTLDEGVFHGDVDGNTNKFLGIPYAKPP